MDLYDYPQKTFILLIFCVKMIFMDYNTELISQGLKSMDNNGTDKSEMTQRISRDSLTGLEMKTIPVICPWCNRIFKMSKWEVDRDKKTGVTHGICPECFDKTLKDASGAKDSVKLPTGSGSKSSKIIKKPEVPKTGAADRFRKFFKLKP